MRSAWIIYVVGGCSWQAYRTWKDQGLELEFLVEESKASSNQVVIKVVEIFGNDTNKLVEVHRAHSN